MDAELSKIKYVQDELATAMELIASIASESVNNLSLTKDEDQLLGLKDIAATFAKEDEETRLLFEAAQATKRKIIAEGIDNPDLVEELLNEAIKEASQKDGTKSQMDATYEGISKFIDKALGAEEEEEEGTEQDESLIMTGHVKPDIPKDPISQCEVRTAVRNIQCNHVYDKETITQYISKGPKRCPAIACQNKMLRLEDMIPDLEIQRMIDLKHKKSK